MAKPQDRGPSTSEGRHGSVGGASAGFPAHSSPPGPSPPGSCRLLCGRQLPFPAHRPCRTAALAPSLPSLLLARPARPSARRRVRRPSAAAASSLSHPRRDVPPPRACVRRRPGPSSHPSWHPAPAPPPTRTACVKRMDSQDFFVHVHVLSSTGFQFFPPHTTQFACRSAT